MLNMSGSRSGRTRARSAHPGRALALSVLACLGFLLGTSGCGFEAQTQMPYTPALGVNADVGPDAAVKVRNLLLATRQPGQAFASATLVSAQADALVTVTGAPIGPDGTEGAQLETTLTRPIQLEPGNLVLLTERPPILMRSPDILPGATARVTLRFRQAGGVTMLTPIYQDQEELATVTPSLPPPSR